MIRDFLKLKKIDNVTGIFREKLNMILSLLFVIQFQIRLLTHCTLLSIAFFSDLFLTKIGVF